MQQQLDKHQETTIASILVSIFIFLVTLLLTEGDIDSFWIMLPTLAFASIGLFSYLNGKIIEKDLSLIPKDEKEDNLMKAIEFKSAEIEIENLDSSKEIEYKPLYREKDIPEAHKLILDHTNRNIYSIILDQIDKKESIEYRKVPHSEIVQAAVIIDEVIISKSSLVSKVGGIILY